MSDRSLLKYILENPRRCTYAGVVGYTYDNVRGTDMQVCHKKILQDGYEGLRGVKLVFPGAGWWRFWTHRQLTFLDLGAFLGGDDEAIKNAAYSALINEMSVECRRCRGRDCDVEN